MKILIAYIPVIHQGYLDLIRKVKPDAFYILGKEFFEEFRPIQKEIRKLSPEIICEQLKVSGTGVDDIQVLTRDFLFDVIGHTSNKVNVASGISRLTFALPSEDISHLFAEKYLADQEVEFVDFFLRWDTQASLKQREVGEILKADLESFESQMLGLAYDQASRSSDFWRQVGAVLVKDKEITLKAYNTHLPSANAPYIHGDPRGNFKKGIQIELSTAIHAEAGIIAAAAKKGISLLDSELFVTTFPCPPCAKLIACSGIKKLYFTAGYSMLDGEEILRGEGVDLVQVAL